LYFQEGVFHTTQVETPYGPPVRNANAAVYRFEPRTRKFEVYVSYDFANPHGHVFDRWEKNFVMDGTGAEPYIGACFPGLTYYPGRHKRAPKLYEQRTRPCPGMEILSSRQFPEKWQGRLLVANVIAFWASCSTTSPTRVPVLPARKLNRSFNPMTRISGGGHQAGPGRVDLFSRVAEPHHWTIFSNHLRDSEPRPYPWTHLPPGLW